MQGSGKGTQASMIQKNVGLLPISSGQLLRDEIASDTTDGAKAKVFLGKGRMWDVSGLLARVLLMSAVAELVPDDLIVSILKHQLMLPSFFPVRKRATSSICGLCMLTVCC
jgi:hypothetical protein